MNRNESHLKQSFKSRASLARPNSRGLSYKERLAKASEGKKAGGVDLGVTADSAGYIVIN